MPRVQNLRGTHPHGHRELTCSLFLRNLKVPKNHTCLEGLFKERRVWIYFLNVIESSLRASLIYLPAWLDCTTSGKPLSQSGLRFSLLYHERIEFHEPSPPNTTQVWYYMILWTQNKLLFSKGAGASPRGYQMLREDRHFSSSSPNTSRHLGPNFQVLVCQTWPNSKITFSP